jgi:hypothetical protein
MAYVASAEERQRYLRRARQAAGAALDNGCTLDEVVQAVEEGIAEVQAERERRSGSRPVTQLVPRETGHSRGTPALDALRQAVGL